MEHTKRIAHSLITKIRGGPATNASHTTPHLEHKAEFEEALAHYQMNPAAEEIVKNTRLVVMNGPTSTGRNTVINELLKTGHYHFIVSDTTRPPRYNDGVLEVHGVNYFFRNEDDMLEDVRRGEFLEAELIHEQQVSGQSIREIKKAHDQGKVAVSEIEIMGILNTLKLKPDAVAILLLPPSFEEWLRRIQQRTAVSQIEMNRRLRTAIKIFNIALNQDVFIFVVNDKLKAAVKTIDEIARLGVHHTDTEQASRKLAEDLLHKTESYLAVHPDEP